MADKKIQIKNSNGDNLFPQIKAANITDNVPASKIPHTHTFTGTAKTISVSGTYAKPTGITINQYTPAGNVSQPSFSGSISLGANTTSTGGIKYVEAVSHNAASASGTTPVINKVTPATGSFVNNVTTSTTSATGDIAYVSNVSVSSDAEDTEYLHFSQGSLPTRSQFTYVSGITGGSLTTDSTAAGGIAYVSSISGGGVSQTKGDYTPAGSVSSRFTGTAKNISFSYTPAGSIALTNGTAPSLSSVSTSGGIQYVRDVSYTAPTATKGSYTPGGSVSSSFTGRAKSISVSGTPSGTISLTGGSAPSLTINSTASGGTAIITGHTNVGKTTANAIISVTHTPASASGTRNFVTGVNGGSGSLTGTLSGTTLVLTHTHNAASASGTAAAVTGVNGGGVTTSSSTFVTNVTGGTATTSYLHFSAGSLRSGATFTGNRMTLSTSYTPEGTVNSTFAGTATTALVTAVSGGSVTRTLSYLNFSAGTTPKSGATFTGTAATLSTSYTPAGSISSSFTGTKTNSLVTNVSGGGATATTSYLHYAAPSASTAQAQQITGVGTLPSLSHNTTSTNGIAYISSVGNISANVTKAYLKVGKANAVTSISTTTANAVTGINGGGVNVTTKYFHPSVSGTVTKPTFTGTAATLTGTVTTSNTTISSSGSYTPAGTVGTAQ